MNKNNNRDDKSLRNKLLVISGLLILSGIPRLMTSSLIEERENFAFDAKQSVIKGWAEAQEDLGNIEVKIPRTRVQENEKGQRSEYAAETLIVLPHERTIDVKSRSEFRERGIYTIPVQNIDFSMDAQFSLEEGLKSKNIVIEKNKKDFIKVNASDIRVEIPMSHPESLNAFELSINDKKVSAKRNLKGIEFLLKEFTDNQEEIKILKIKVKLSFKSFERLGLSVPSGQSQIKVDSDWPSPSFGGLLPRNYKIHPAGFTSEWSLFDPLATQKIEIQFFDRVNIYKQSEKSLKYGFLITLFCLTVFFMFEVLGNLRLHFMHYIFLSLPLSVFFIVLIAFSEHLNFLASYSIAAVGVISLMAAYLKGIGATRKQNLGFATALGSTYGTLFFLLQSTDYALLLGSLALFSILAGIMLITRNVNWNNLHFSKEKNEVSV